MTQVIITNTPAKEAGENISTIIRDHAGDIICILSGESHLDVVEHIDTSKHCFHQTCTEAVENKNRDGEIKCQRNECRTIFIMGDEEVSRGSKLSNYEQCKLHYPDHAVTRNLIETIFQADESEKQFTERIEKIFLETLLELNNPKIISVQGVDPDGHTVGIFPMSESSFRRVYQDDRTCVLVPAEGLRIDPRASFTPAWILNNADIIISCVVGKDKLEILNKLNLESKKLNERPAELINLHHNSYLYTDQDIED